MTQSKYALIAATAALVIFVIAVRVALANSCSGECNATTITCTCEGGGCRIDCGGLIPRCVCPCG